MYKFILFTGLIVFSLILGNLVYLELTSFKRFDCQNMTMTKVQHYECEMTNCRQSGCVETYHHKPIYYLPNCDENQPRLCCKERNVVPYVYPNDIVCDSICNIIASYQISVCKNDYKCVSFLTNYNDSVTCWSNKSIIQLNYEQTSYIIPIIIFSILLFINGIVLIYQKKINKNKSQMILLTEI